MAGIHISTRVDADAFAVFVRDDAGVEISNATVTVTRRRVDGTGEPVTKQGDLYPLTTDLCAYDIKASDGTNEVSDNIFAKSSVTTPAFGEYDKNFRDVALQLAFTSAGVLVIVFLLGAIVWFWGLDPATRAQPAPLSAVIALLLSTLAALLVAGAIWLGALDVRGALREPKPDGVRGLTIGGILEGAAKVLAEVKNVPSARLLAVAAVVPLIGVAWIGGELAQRDQPTVTCVAAVPESTVVVPATTAAATTTAATAAGAAPETSSSTSSTSSSTSTTTKGSASSSSTTASTASPTSAAPVTASTPVDDCRR